MQYRRHNLAAFDVTAQFVASGHVYGSRVKREFILSISIIDLSMTFSICDAWNNSVVTFMVSVKLNYK